MAHGPSCSVACGIFPDQGSNPCPLHWQVDSYHCTTREVPILAFIIAFFFTFLRSLFLHSASNYCLVSFHFTLQDSHAYFLQSTSSAHKLPQLLFIWECPNFSLTFEGQFCLISDFLINLFIYLFIIYFWLCWVFVSV